MEHSTGHGFRYKRNVVICRQKDWEPTNMFFARYWRLIKSHADDTEENKETWVKSLMWMYERFMGAKY